MPELRLPLADDLVSTLGARSQLAIGLEQPGPSSRDPCLVPRADCWTES